MQQAVDVPLAPLTTMRVGGPADRLVTASSTEELVQAVSCGRRVPSEPVLVLSGGSNLVVADAGFAGTVVRVATRGVHVESADFCGGVSLRVAAGEDWDALVARAVTEGWSGIEALSGIPGYAGSTPIQNVGAYGQEVAATIAQVRVWDRHTRSVRTIANADCGFAYRDSLFKRSAGRYVVLEVLFQLPVADLSAPVRYPALADELGVPEGTRVPLAEVRAAVLSAAPAPGHGPGRGRPRHVELRVVLHQPRPDRPQPLPRCAPGQPTTAKRHGPALLAGRSTGR